MLSWQTLVVCCQYRLLWLQLCSFGLSFCVGGSKAALHIGGLFTLQVFSLASRLWCFLNGAGMHSVLLWSSFAWCVVVLLSMLSVWLIRSSFFDARLCELRS